MIDKKKIIKSLIIISLIIIIIFAAIQIRNTLARYETTTTTLKDVDVAFWVVDNSFKSQRLVIDEIYPKNTPFEYKFTVSNFNPGTLESEIDDIIAETDMEYDLVLTMSTNLPLSYEIYRNEEICTNMHDELFEDEDGTVYRKLTFSTDVNPYPFIIDTINNSTKNKSKITDEYILEVLFPEQMNVNGVSVDNRMNLEYADLMETIKIELTARQKIN